MWGVGSTRVLQAYPRTINPNTSSFHYQKNETNPQHLSAKHGCRVWCFVVLCGLVWCGVEGSSVVCCGVIGWGVVQCGAVWCGAVGWGVVVLWCGLVWCGWVACCVVW